MLQAVHRVEAKQSPLRYACPQCQRVYVTRWGMQVHAQRVHEQLMRFRCATCGKGFSVRSNYFDHLATHSGVKKHVCAICQARFTFKCSLKVHRLRFHWSEVAFKCKAQLSSKCHAQVLLEVSIVSTSPSSLWCRQTNPVYTWYQFAFTRPFNQGQLVLVAGRHCRMWRWVLFVWRCIYLRQTWHIWWIRSVILMPRMLQTPRWCRKLLRT